MKVAKSHITDPFDHSRFVGYVSFVSPSYSRVHFPSSTLLNKFRHAGEELQAGLVGSYVAIEGENYGFLGRIAEISLPEKERLDLSEKAFQTNDFHPTGKVELLLSFDYYSRRIKKGLDQFPAVGSKVFICSSDLLREFFEEFGVKDIERPDPILFRIATLAHDDKTEIYISPQAIFGRHCAVVGTTGGGKSYTVATLIEEVIYKKGKAILIDATGEFKDFDSREETLSVTFCKDTFLHYSNLKVSDLYVLFRPSEQVQLPKLNDAIRSLKLLKAIENKPQETLSKAETQVKGFRNNSGLKKSGNSRNALIGALKANPSVNDPFSEFDMSKLPYQIPLECVFETGTIADNFGNQHDRDLGFCQSLITRIFFVLQDETFNNILGFQNEKNRPEEFTHQLSEFINSPQKSLFRISLEKVPFEAHVREILVNAIGRFLLEKARNHEFRSRPIVVFMDEAHQFLNKQIKGEFAFEVELNAFDQIAKECRKYGLFLTISTQLPRDIPHGTLSQIGTFITHRLINPNDKDAVENACPEANKYALSYLPILGQGEALLMGVDFPMPVILKIRKPNIEPQYGTPVIFPRD